MIEKLYTVEEVAELASVTGRTIRNYLKSGKLVGRKIGGQWRFPESEVQRLLTGYEPEDEAPAAVTFAAQAVSQQATPVEAAPTPVQQAAPVTQAPVPVEPVSAPVQSQPPIAQQSAQATPQPVEYYPAPEPVYAPAEPQPYIPPQAKPATSYPGYTPPAPLPSAVPPSPSQHGYAPAYSPPTYVPPQPVYEQPVQPEPEYLPPQQLYQAPVQPELSKPDPVPPPAPEPEDITAETTVLPEAGEVSPDILSDVGLKVLQYAAQVHDCSLGPQTCSIVELNQTLQAAKATSERLADIARQESAEGIPCECYVEFDERYSIARYTLFGSTAFLLRCLQLIG